MSNCAWCAFSQFCVSDNNSDLYRCVPRDIFILDDEKVCCTSFVDGEEGLIVDDVFTI